MAAIDVFMHAIRIQESGNNYAAYNAGSGAAGAYQFTQGTWRGALDAAGYGGTIWPAVRPDRAPAWVQDLAANFLMSRYYNQFGHSWYNVAEAWYGGPGAVGHPNWGGGPGYPNVGQYAAQVVAIFNRLGGNAGGAGAAPPPPPATNSTWNAAVNNWFYTQNLYGSLMDGVRNRVIAPTRW